MNDQSSQPSNKTSRLRFFGDPRLWSSETFTLAEHITDYLQSPFTVGHDTYAFRLDRFSADQCIATLSVEGASGKTFYASHNGHDEIDALKQLYHSVTTSSSLLPTLSLSA
jgi:hypothetical protein